jgi:hypothetical protein
MPPPLAANAVLSVAQIAPRTTDIVSLQQVSITLDDFSTTQVFSLRREREM